MPSKNVWWPGSTGEFRVFHPPLKDGDIPPISRGYETKTP